MPSLPASFSRVRKKHANFGRHRLVVFDAVGNHPKRNSRCLDPGLGLARAIGHYARQIGRFGDPTTVGLAGQRLGLKEVDEGIWLISFMHYDLGYIDLEQKTSQTIDNPFGTRLSPMS